MDPRDRADALLSHAQARSQFVVTPERATSPMDAADTQRIPQSVLTALDEESDPDTAVLPTAVIAANDQANQDATPTTPLDVPASSVTTPMARPAPDDEGLEEVGGLVPTAKPPSSGRSDLARRLDGF